MSLRSSDDIDGDPVVYPPKKRVPRKVSDRIGKPPPRGLITYTANYLAEILTNLHSKHDYPAVYPWEPRAFPTPRKEITPRLEGKLKLVQRKDNGTWVVLETVPNGKQDDTYEDGTTLFARLEKLERIILNTKPPSPKMEPRPTESTTPKEPSLLERYGESNK